MVEDQSMAVQNKKRGDRPKDDVFLFDRQRRLLALLAALGGSVGKLDFQKLLFLFCQEQGSAEPYEFVPYRFGGFSFTSYADRRKLIELGILAANEEEWVLTDAGWNVVGRNQDLQLSAFVSRHRELRGDALVAEAYRRFPYYATRSEIAERVLRGDKDALKRIAHAQPTAAGPALMTIGYEGRTLECYLNMLIQAGVTVLCDVRRNPLSRKYGFAKSTLSNGCTNVGIRYLHLPELGIASEDRQGLVKQSDYDALFEEYERDALPKQGAALELIRDLVRNGDRVALTCYELLPQQCHRHCVAKALEKGTKETPRGASLTTGVGMEKQRVLITVKTYPTLSRKYGETVCTAGVRADGTWVRIYPVPFRRLDEEQQYRKFDWVECRLARNTTDVRPETFRPLDENELKPAGHMGTGDTWRERRDLLLKKATVYDRLDDLIARAKANTTSLAVFKPTRVTDFFWEQESAEWDPEKLRQMRDLHSQQDLFSDNTWRKTFEVIPKLPYSFSYKFSDAAGRESEMQILDWEVGALYWNCVRASPTTDGALAKVRQKYFDSFLKTDLHFFLGTTQQWHQVAPNPWVIIGVFPVPHEKQLGLL